MSSVRRSIAPTKEGLTRCVKIESPSYSNGTDIVLFPFVYTNGQLDISYDGNNFEADLVDTTGVAPGAPGDEIDTAYRIVGGPRLVTSLGDNFKAYIRAWRDATIDSGSPIEVYTPSQVIRVQQVDNNNVTANSGAPWEASIYPPASDNYITGDTTNRYLTTYIFKTPLTFTTVEGGVTTYITFHSYVDQE